MRNGIIADTLRKGGSPFKIIFGLNIPQIVDIAAQTPHTVELATALWTNNTTRESMLLAPMLMPVESMSEPMALEWIEVAPSTEIIDNLCHKLLRKSPLMPDLAFKLAESPLSVHRYAAMRLFWSILNTHSTDIQPIAQKEILRADALTLAPATQIVSEIQWING